MHAVIDRSDVQAAHTQTGAGYMYPAKRIVITIHNHTNITSKAFMSDHASGGKSYDDSNTVSSRRQPLLEH